MKIIGGPMDGAETIDSTPRIPIQPVGQYILGELRDAAEPSNIILPSSAKAYPCHEILAIGDEVTKFKVGDRVFVNPHMLQGFCPSDPRFMFLENAVFGKIIQ